MLQDQSGSIHALGNVNIAEIHNFFAWHTIFNNLFLNSCRSGWIQDLFYAT